MVYIAYQYPDYGFYPEGAQYINTPWVTLRNTASPRALQFRNESLWPADSSTPMTYSAWCQDLAAKGTKVIRIIWDARHMPWTDAYGLEPPPHGTFNVWHNALDDSNLTTFRSQQVSGSPGDASFPISYWNNSNIKGLFDACDQYGVEVIVELSHNAEFTDYWTYHPWNYNNRYMNGTSCEAQDRGFLSSAVDFYTDSQAIQAMKDRITFVVNLIGGYKSVCMWGIMSEGAWLLNPGFFGESSYTTAWINYIRNDACSWYATIAQHIRDTDTYNRPIMVSVGRPPSTGEWPSDPNHPFNVRNEPFLERPIDIVAVNAYASEFETKVLNMNLMREHVYPKMVFIHQYYPSGWYIGMHPRREYAPYVESKRVEWIGAVMKWSVGPGRWPGLVESDTDNVWTKGGYADADWYGIGSITANFRSYINWKDWSGAEDWADYTSSTGLDYSMTTGDGDHFCGLLVWTSGGAKTLTISNVTDGAWTFRVFDWTDGTLDATSNPTASSNSVSVSVTPSTYYQAVVYGEKD